MRRIFSGYYRPSDEEFSDLWRDCLFVLDANVLLNLYRYSKDTNEDLIRVLSVVSERLWLPHQVALEYQDNRLDIISGQEIVYQEIPRILEDAQKKIRGLFRQEHLSIDVDSMLKTVESAFEVIRRELNKHRSRHPDLFRNDHIRDTITSLFEGKVGLPYSQDEVDKLSRKGESRYQNQVPPGYKDLKDKQGRTKRYGSTVVKEEYGAVSYTHLTLPTIYPGYISVVAVPLKKKNTKTQVTLPTLHEIAALVMIMF